VRDVIVYGAADDEEDDSAKVYVIAEYTAQGAPCSWSFAGLGGVGNRKRTESTLEDTARLW
jgi:hypothetical protein